MKTRQLLICKNAFEAYLIKGKLENEGIYSYLINENFSALMPHYFGILGSGIYVIIRETDYIKAKQILNTNKDELTCPNCGSNNIKFRLGKNRLGKNRDPYLSCFPTGKRPDKGSV